MVPETTITLNRFDVQVGQSLVKTQHKVLIVNSKAEKSDSVRTSPRHRVQVLDYNPLSAGLLRQALARYNWKCICEAIDAKSESIDTIYNDFVCVVKWHINNIVPVRNVSMRDRDPTYVTPRIKLLLRKRNRLRRADKIESADHIAIKINKLIARNRSVALTDAKDTDTKQLWALLKQTGNWGSKK